MPYGAWFQRAWRGLWGNSRVWILLAPWLLLTWVAQGLLGGTAIGLQARMERLMRDPLAMRDLVRADTAMEFLQALVALQLRLLGGRWAMVLAGLVLGAVAWLVSFIIMGAIIHQAMPSHSYRPSPAESLRAGVRRAPRLFLIWLVVYLPMLVATLIVMVPVGVMFLLVVGERVPSDAIGEMFVILFGGMCFFGLFALAWKIFAALYTPLAAQACVQEELSVREALVRSWHVFWRRLGAVILLGVLAFLLTMGVTSFVGAGTYFFRLGLQFLSGAWTAVGVLAWIPISLLHALAAVVPEVLVWLIYTHAWPDLARTDVGEAPSPEAGATPTAPTPATP